MQSSARVRMKTDRSCSRVREVQALLYSTAPLDEEAFRELTAHLDQCEMCRRAAQVDNRETALEDAVRSIDRQANMHPYQVRMPVERLNKLLPHYEIQEEIGRGGMGVVYRARQLSLDRVVALKFLPAILGVMQPEAVSRFRREAAITAGLKHSNIIAVYDSGEADGTFYYAMELIEGRSLHDIVVERRRSIGSSTEAPSQAEASAVPTDPAAADLELDPARGMRDPEYIQCVTEWIADAAEALDYAHDNGVIHRDVKPSNLLLTRHGRVMISDFGLARPSFAATMTLSPVLMGTCRYMSPEQVDSSGKTIDHRTDIYSLGVTLYEMLALAPPFADTDYHRIIHGIVHTEPPPLRRRNPNIPRDLETICLRAMSKDRRKRYQSARAMSDDLRRVRLGLPIRARRPSRLQRAGRWLRRHPKAVALSACFVFLLGALAFSVNVNERLKREALAAKAGEVHQWLFEAQAEMADGGAHAALALVESALVAYPERMELRILKGRLLWKDGRIKDARRYLNQQLECDPNAWPIRQMLARIPVGPADEDSGIPGVVKNESPPPTDTSSDYYLQALCETDSKKAVALLDESLKLDPDNLLARSYRCLCLGDTGDYQRMLLDAYRVVDARPRWAVTQGELGRALRWVGRAEEADAALSLAIGIEPERAKWYAMRSEARFYLGQFKRSLSDAETALKLNPDIGMAYTVRGSIQMATGKIDEGEADFRKAIELMPTSPQPYIRRGLLRARRGSWQAGLADLTRATELDPDIICPWDNSRVCIHHHRGLCYLTGRRYPEAIAEFTIALELPPKRWTRSLLPRAMCYFRTFQFKECIGDTTRAINLELADPVAYVRRATAYELIGENEHALADYRAVVQMKAQSSRYAIAASYMLLHELGRNEQARSILAGSPLDPLGEGDFLSRAFAMLRGDLSSEQFVESAENLVQRADALFLAGRWAESNGDRVLAATHYERCGQLDSPNTFLAAAASARLHVLQTRTVEPENSEGHLPAQTTPPGDGADRSAAEALYDSNNAGSMIP